LAKIRSDLESRLEKIGHPKENRAFKSHLTIGRTKGGIDPKRLAEALRGFSEFSSPPFQAKELVLYKSELKPSGAVYSELACARLGEAR
jgi:2'-5' RNA ligase